MNTNERYNAIDRVSIFDIHFYNCHCLGLREDNAIDLVKQPGHSEKYNTIDRVNIFDIYCCNCQCVLLRKVTIPG